MKAVSRTSAPANDMVIRNRDLVAGIEKSQLFIDYRSAFETATGLPLAIRAAGSFQLPLAGASPKRLNSFCQLMAGRNGSCSACLEVQAKAEEDAGDGIATLECFAGLHDSVVSIRIGEAVVAYLQTGQVMFQAPTKKKFRAVAKQLERWGATSEMADLEAAYFQTRVLGRANYDAAVRLLGSFAAHLSLLANELMIKKTAAEPIGVVKARAFIAEHLDEPLALPDVARAAGMSVFYFCKIFKTAVGVTFTDYVARTRIEKTKQMLLDVNVRISEAAFAGGFQSLSQFNRVFRRVTGESPTQYREQLHHTSSRDALAFAA